MSDKPRMLAPPEADAEENHGTLDAERSAVRRKNLTQQPHVENQFAKMLTHPLMEAIADFSFASEA